MLKIIFVFQMLLLAFSFSQRVYSLPINKNTIVVDDVQLPDDSILLAADLTVDNVINTKSVGDDTQAKSFKEIELNISAPSSARVNKPFVVTFRFPSPVHDFDRDNITVSNGDIVFFSGNSNNNVYRVQLLANKGLDQSSDPYIDVEIQSTLTGTIRKRIKILPSKNKTLFFETLDDITAPIKPHGYSFLQLSRGGDTVDADASYNIGNTYGFQLGGSYPLPHTTTELDKLIPRGSVRMLVGYEQMEEGSKSKGDRTTFSVTTLDILYDIRFSDSVHLLAGLTSGFNGKVKAQSLKLRDFLGENEGEVEFENAYGFKFITEYIAFKTSYVDFIISAGFSVINYIPSKIVVVGNEELSLNSPTRVGANSFKLLVGLRI